MIDKNIQEMVLMSQAVGRDPADVQGGGGNTSIKLDAQEMIIKASGGLLKEITSDSGYSVVNYRDIKQYLNAPDSDEKTFIQAIKSSVVKTNNRPSMETGFHALLDRYVIHTHSIYANLLTCSTKGQEIIQHLFPSALWIDYATPGLALTLAIKKKMSTLLISADLIFLKNHGVIVTGNTMQLALDRYQSMKSQIQRYFGIYDGDFDVNKQLFDIAFVRENVLFPDQVVYTLAGEHLLTTNAAKETLAAYSFILHTFKAIGLMPEFIPRAQAHELFSLESEKYRQQAITAHGGE